MRSEGYVIDVSSVDESRLPKKNHLEQARKLWYKFSLNKISVLGLAIILVILFVAIFYKYIAPYPEDIGAVVKFSEASQAPSFAHIMGTDTTGRDIFSRICYAFRGAFTMGIAALS